MIDRNHPAVEAANKAVKRAYGSRGGEALNYHATALRAALPHLTADDLRQLPQVQALMAEAWQEGALHQARGSAETRRVLASALPNPYLETANE